VRRVAPHQACGLPGKGLTPEGAFAEAVAWQIARRLTSVWDILHRYRFSTKR
jgi:hypothetical protein